MIKFEPELKHVDYLFSDIEGHVSNIANESLAKQTQELFGDKFCKKHPHFENKMLVHFKGKEDSIMTVTSYCCEEFKEKLDLLCINKNPFTD